MLNETERLQLEMGRNERWGPSCRLSGGFMINQPLTSGKPVKVKSRMSKEDKARTAKLRERLDPKKF